MLNSSQLNELKKFDAPTICNAIQLFNIRPKTSGFMNSKIRKVFNNSLRTVGYAATAKITAMHQQTKSLADDYYQQVHSCPKPVVSVIQDTDPAPIGSFWGEVQATIHLALGCEAVVTSGGVRDIDEAEALGFEFYSSCILVSHAYINVVEAGGTVDVGGLGIRPRELIFADKHGVIVIPDNVAPYLAEACLAAAAAEQPVLENCRNYFGKSLYGEQVPLENLKKWRAEMHKLRNEATEKFSALLK